jgi:hypothetical protein
MLRSIVFTAFFVDASDATLNSMADYFAIDTHSLKVIILSLSIAVYSRVSISNLLIQLRRIREVSFKVPANDWHGKGGYVLLILYYSRLSFAPNNVGQYIF